MADRLRAPKRPYPRTARVNALLLEVIAEEVERIADLDERLRLLTVTAVECDPDLRHASVFLASLPPLALEGLEEHRRGLQRAVGEQVRMKRLPLLRFAPDPVIETAARVEAALRRARLGVHPDEP